MNKQLCVPRSSRVFIRSIVHTCNLTLTGCVWYFASVYQWTLHSVGKLVNKNNCNKKGTAFLSCGTFKLSLDSKWSDVTTIKLQYSEIMYNLNNKSSIVFLAFHIRYARASVTAFPFSLTGVGLSA